MVGEGAAHYTRGRVCSPAGVCRLRREDLGARSRVDATRIRGFIAVVVVAKPRSLPAKWKNRYWSFDELLAEVPESNLPAESA